MNDGESKPTHKPSDGHPDQSHAGVDWGLIVISILAFVALLFPHFSNSFAGVYWAAAVAIAVWSFWVKVMPTSCINGGLIYSFLAITILLNTVGFMLIAIVRFVVALFA